VCWCVRLAGSVPRSISSATHVIPCSGRPCRNCTSPTLRRTASPLTRKPFGLDYSLFFAPICLAVSIRRTLRVAQSLLRHPYLALVARPQINASLETCKLQFLGHLQLRGYQILNAILNMQSSEMSVRAKETPARTTSSSKKTP
jgi:hypothetical protein